MAENYYLKSVKINGKNYQTLKNLGNLYYNQFKNYKKSVKYF